MNSSKINDWLQVVGLFGVIGSLLFVGLQMKQEQEIARSQAYQARSDQITSIMTEMAAIPSFRSGFVKIEQGNQTSLTPDELMAMTMFQGSVFNFYENVHYQYVNGFLDEEHWNKSRDGIKNFLRFEIVRRNVRTNLAGWRDSFRKLIEELIAEIDAEKTQ